MSTSKTALPKYVQIAEMLIREIAAGRLADGARLPTERAMAQDFGIAVGTLRKALDDLERRNLLKRVQGSGNYVQYRPDAAGIYALFRLELIEGGGLPTAEILTVDRVPMPDGIWNDEPTSHRIRRLRRLSDKPAAVEEIWLSGRWAESLPQDELSESLYLFYRKQLGLWISTVEDRVGVGTVPDWCPEEFPLATGQVAGYVERRGHTADGEIAEFSRTWFDSDNVRYVSRLR